jgi:hypothetical protein
MGEFKGTKGKWVQVKKSGYFEPLASTLDISPEYNEDNWICMMQNIGVINGNEAKANALIISKAPEMLEMLKEVSKHHQGGHSEIGFKIKQLIKEATEI